MMNLPPYNSFPALKGNSILLRQIDDIDIEDIMEISFYDGKPANTKEEALEMQTRINQDYKNGTSVHWGIADNMSNEVMGTVGYYRGFEGGMGELGFVLRAKFRGQGIMTSAIKLAINFGLDVILLKKIIAITTVQNQQAIKLLERVNFIPKRHLEDDHIEFQFNGKR